jgi:hypothetical protein
VTWLRPHEQTSDPSGRSAVISAVGRRNPTATEASIHWLALFESSLIGRDNRMLL